MKNPPIAVDAAIPAPRALSRLGSRLQLAAGLALLALACGLALTLNSYYVFVIVTIALTAIVGIGLNVLLGLTGQVSFGHVGFYAIGAYAVAILTTGMGWSFWLAWPAAALIAGAFGLLLALPALRVKGPYLAMITIAFSFIVQHAIVEMRGLTGGQNGIMGVTAPSLGVDLGGERVVALLALFAAALLFAAYARLARGTWGAAMRAVKDSETAAESIGLNPLVIKTVAFAVSAMLAGLAGGLFAPLSGFVTPDSFGFMQSILFMLVVVVGGAGATAGPLAGALVVGLLPELLSALAEYRLLFFGGLLLLVLWVAPDGIVGTLRKLLQRLQSPAAPSAWRAALPALILPGRQRKALAAHELGMTFGGVRAVSKLGFEVPVAAVTSLIGPNGAGKTTALNMLSGFYRPTAGGFSLGGQALQGLAAFQVARRGIARTYQTSQLFGTLSVEDNVALAVCRGRLGMLLGSARYAAPAVRQLSRQLLLYCGYQGALDTPAADLAHVDRRLVEIARALAADPDVLLLDEPAAGLSSDDKRKLAQLLRRIADAGVSVVLVEHDMTLVMDISDRLVVLDAGQRLAVGTPAEIQDDPAVRQAYLGDAAMLDGSGRVARAAADTPEVLGVGALVTGYGAEPVLHGIDLQVRRGEMVALLGANGAGKSTLMRALAGLQRPVRGGIHFEGVDLTRLPAEAIVARGLVLVPEGRQVFGELSVLDNIRLGAFLDPRDMDKRVEEMLQRFPRLRERLHQRAGLLSGGEQQMLAVARGLMSRPRILLLDEPSLGLAPKVIAELFAALDRLRSEGMTILLVDQMAALALALADRAYVIEGGRVVAQGTAAEIAADDALAQAYLGAH
ncbi:branched-chain amino acid ABC transporter ATP-binding protein/permease [Noviherbaspirillum suwonense]|uniref:Monosaccharide ABC transporter ATP-binding protein, CUT2 family n=1 Tax=Noviherbaspirillum suwonense TaxID=1224511 RepID=A0ABY1QBI6_9BURK|nr:branched-chain amino acid ABC transporter ATP-binding protein/permease [Noviherbaspirillum suwonense]SMP65781.1 monosaccharide ABC transporter ATP-binding protein, CUT2 family [Noviherbaspirillum suwonense]